MRKEDFKILVVDDDDIARDAISSILKGEGYPVVTAKDGIEAIGLLRVEDIKLVITDLRMPGADGIEVLKYTVKNTPETMVVIVTAYGTLDVALEVIKEGAYDYLAKPFNVEEIVFLSTKAFERALLIQELKELRELLRKTYREIEVINNIAKSNNPEIITNWLERIERLKDKKILTDEEAKILKERLIKGNG